MAVAIRLTRLGRKKVPLYRIVVTDHESKRDGRHIEFVGTYNPKTKPPTLVIKEDRVKYWVGVGATPSATVAKLIEKQLPGYLTDIVKKRKAKIVAKRKARKARAGGATKTKKAAKKK